MTSHTESPISIEALKRHAKRLQKEIKKNNPIFKLSEAQDLLARTFGLNNWHEMNETLNKNSEENRLKKEFLDNCENGFSITGFIGKHKDIKVAFDQALYIATKNGHEFILTEILEDYLPKHSEVKVSDQTKVHCLTLACIRGHLHIIKYLLAYYEKNNLMNKISMPYIFTKAYHNGHFKIIKYLLEESSMKEHLNQQQIIDKAFLQTTIFENMEGVFGNKHFQIIQYLLTSKNIPYRANINIKNSECLKELCFNKEIIQYLLTSKELKEHANIYNDSGKIFEFIYQKAEEWQYYEVVDYLMNDYKIERTPEIMQVINKYGSIRDNRSNQDMKCIINC